MKATTAERITEWLKQTGHTQAELVELCQPICKEEGVKINKSDISQYKTGKAVPKQDKLYVLSKAMDVDPGWLMGSDVPVKKGNFVIKEVFSDFSDYSKIVMDELMKRFNETSFEETLYMSYFRQLNEEGQKKVLIYMEDLLANPRNKKTDPDGGSGPV